MIQIFGSYLMTKSKIFKILPKILKFLFFVKIFSSMVLAEGCFPTSPGGTPITTTPPPSGDCCPALEQSRTTTVLADGLMSFVYNSDTCRSTVTITCQQPQGQGLELSAAIVANQVNFIVVALDTVTAPATCSNGVWLIAEPPLPITSIQCVLTDPV